MSAPRVILVAVDFDESARQILDYAVGLAARLGARLHVIRVMPWPLIGAEVPVGVSQTTLDKNVERAERALDDLVAPHEDKLVFGSRMLKVGDARSEILAAARALSADLILMGTHGRRGISRLVLGSVAESVTREAPCPVLLVHPQLEA